MNLGNLGIEMVALPLHCDRHGDQTVERIKAIGGRVFDRVETLECPLCRDERSKAERRAWEVERAQMRCRQLITAARIPQRYQGATFADYTTSLPGQAKNQDLCRRYVDALAADRYPGWLVLTGRPGTGKTMLLSCMAVALAEAQIRCRYTTQAGLGREFRATYQANAEHSEAEVFDACTRMPVLLLDELGAGGTEHTDRLVFEVLDTRYANHMPVVIATNHPRSDLQHVLGERLFDRLKEEAAFLAFDWESQRKPAGLRHNAAGQEFKHREGHL